MRRLFFALMLISFVLVACSPSEEMIAAAIAETQAAWTPIPTQVPLPTYTPYPTYTPLPLLPPPPSPEHTTTPETENDYQLEVEVGYPFPRYFTRQTITGRLLKKGEPVAGAKMYCIAHYKNKDKRYPVENGFEQTDERGEAIISFNIGKPAVGFKVLVEVFMLTDTIREEVSFTATK